MLSIVVSTERRQEVGVGLQVGDLEDVVPAGVAWTLGHVLYWFHLEMAYGLVACFLNSNTRNW